MVNLFTIFSHGLGFGLGSLKCQTFFIVMQVFYVGMLPIGCQETRTVYNRYPSRRRSDTMDYLLLCVGVVIWVRYLCRLVRQG